MKLLLQVLTIAAIVAYLWGWFESRRLEKSAREWREKDLDVERAKRELDERLERWSREK